MDNIWIELENYYGRLDFLLKLISEEELKPREIDIPSLWQKLKINIEEILNNKKNLDIAIFILFAISKLLELKLSDILNLEKEEDNIIPFNFAFIFELQKIRKILPVLEDKILNGARNFSRGTFAFEKLINVEIKTVENLTLENIYLLYKHRISQLQLPQVEIKKSDYNWHEVVDEFLAILTTNKKINFTSLAAQVKNTYKILLYFVAILELAKENVIEIYQEQLYKDFVVTLKEANHHSTFTQQV
ncbi:MAG: segregation/condensation protein A [Planctomycetota bacterium]